MTIKGVPFIRKRVQTLHERGVFQAPVEEAGRAGKRVFRFRWLLGTEFVLECDPAKRRLKIRDLLPFVEKRSFLDDDLRRFVAGRTDKSLPAHRRVDPKRAELAYTNHRQSVSLIMNVHDGQYAYAVTALLKVANQLFAHLRLHHIGFLHRHFGLREE